MSIFDDHIASKLQYEDFKIRAVNVISSAVMHTLSVYQTSREYMRNIIIHDLDDLYREITPSIDSPDWIEADVIGPIWSLKNRMPFYEVRIKAYRYEIDGPFDENFIHIKVGPGISNKLHYEFI